MADTKVETEVEVTVMDWHAHRIGCAVLNALEGTDPEIAFDVGAKIAANRVAVDVIMAGLRARNTQEAETDG